MSSASTLVSTFSPNLSQTLSQTFSPGTAYRAEAVARAERDLTASTDRYMRHAAHALALAAVRELRDAVGRVAGAGVILLIGGGHNGGDALLAQPIVVDGVLLVQNVDGKLTAFRLAN